MSFWCFDQSHGNATRDIRLLHRACTIPVSPNLFGITHEEVSETVSLG